MLSAWRFLLPLSTFALLLVSCSLSSRGRNQASVSLGQNLGKNSGYHQEDFQARELDFYLNNLLGLPLHFDQQKALDTRPPEVENYPALRELHLLRDQGSSQEDTLLLVHSDGTVQSWNANDFTSNWVSRLSERSYWDPVMTNHSLFFLTKEGRYHQLNRQDGSLKAQGLWRSGYNPSTQPVANETHLVFPTIKPKAIQGWPDIQNDTVYGSAQHWLYPNSEQSINLASFGVVSLPPVADSEALYFISDNYLYGISVQSGEEWFKTDLGRGQPVRTPPVLQGNLVYTSSAYGEILALNRSGEILWSFDTGGFVDGPIYVLDDTLYFRTLDFDIQAKTGGQYSSLTAGRLLKEKRNFEVTETPAFFSSLHFSRIRPPRLDGKSSLSKGRPDPLLQDEEGNLIYDNEVLLPPKKLDWSIENQNQKVLLKTKKYLFVLYEEWSNPYSLEEVLKFKSQGLIVKDQEVRRYSRRILQVLDPKTGKILRRGKTGQTLSWDLGEHFPFVIGSSQAEDRAIYFGTREGYIFKGIALE